MPKKKTSRREMRSSTTLREVLRQPGAARPDDDVGPRRLGDGRLAGLEPDAVPDRRPRRAAASRAARAGRPSRARRAPRAGRRRRATDRGRAHRPATAIRSARRPRRASSCSGPRSRPSRCANHATPTGSQMRVPVSSCSSSQSVRARCDRSVYHSTLAVRGAREARVTAGARADRSRGVLLDERHVVAAERELARRRGAEHARAHHRDRRHAGGVTVSESTSGRW